jgi:hypothetical protein
MHGTPLPWGLLCDPAGGPRGRQGTILDSGSARLDRSNRPEAGRRSCGPARMASVAAISFETF